MFSFKFFLAEQAKVSPDTSGKLHELIVGYHLNGGKHMEKHKDANGESSQEAHDRLKASIHPDDYKKIHDRAKAAADDIRKTIKKKHGGNVRKVSWTSKPGDLGRSTGINATQEQDASDIVVTDHKGKHHGISLKATDKKSGHVPVSNPGMDATHGAHVHLEKHRKKIDKAYPRLAKAKNRAERKAFLKKNPRADADIKKRNRRVMDKIVDHMHGEMSKMNTKDLAHHLRHKVLKANRTPMQEAGHNHIRHTTYGDHSTHHANPGEDHEHILNDHKNITVHKSGTSIIFKHKGKPFARHRIKFESQSDPKSSVKGSGELIGN